MLTATRTDPGLYFPRDTHWNDRGALIGVQDLVDSLQPGLFDADAYTFTTGGDLHWPRHRPPAHARRSGTARVERAVARRPGVAVTLTDTARSTPGVPVIHEQRSGGPLVPGRVLVLHDSFGRALAPLASPWFADVTWFTVNHGITGNALRDAIGQADTVVIVLTERHLVEQLGELVAVIRAGVGREWDYFFLGRRRRRLRRPSWRRPGCRSGARSAPPGRRCRPASACR